MASAASGVKDQIECVETLCDLIYRHVEHCRNRPGIVAAHREHLAVEVLTLHLDHAQEPGEHLEWLAGQLRKLDQIDRKLQGDRPVVRIALSSVPAALRAYLGKEVIAGIRAEAISLPREGAVETAMHRLVQARVEVIEPTGADTLVVLNLGGHEFTARVEPDAPLAPGQETQFLVDLSKLVCFDVQTEQLIA